MKTPQFSDNEFIDQNALNNAEALTKISLQDIGASLHAPGLVGQTALVLAESGMDINVTAPLPFRVLFASGVLASANGTTNGSSSDTASVSFASLVPSTGSITAYLVASAATVQQNPYQVIGPPLGHPDYNANFAPYTAYAEVQDTLSFTATTTAPDNQTYMEICRVTLTAGQAVITSAEVSTAYQQLATAVLGNAAVQGNLSVSGTATVQGNATVGGVFNQMPPGTILDFAGSITPSGFLICNGAAVSRTTYSNLFLAIGTIWGAGDGSTTFNVPNLARFVTVGSGGTQVSSIGPGTAVGSVGGEETHLQSINELPSHTHAYTSPNNTVDGQISPGSGASGPGSSATTGSTGGGVAFNVMQPSAVVLKIIKT